jgi:protocatechuate 3,4-dioxygenase beta subunit
MRDRTSWSRLIKEQNMQPIRRLLLNLLASVPVTLWLPKSHAQRKLLATPPQPEGPFYPREFPKETDPDLFQYAGATARGTPLELTGRVLRADGSPLANAVMEIWQCDADGDYIYDTASRRAADPGFQGFGKTVTDSTGNYRFVAIRPVPYGGRPPHIHMRIKSDGKELLTTQMYVKGDGAEKDPFVALLPDAARERLMVELVKAPNGLATNFDIVLGSA